jgi:signal transduction histidine kinase
MSDVHTRVVGGLEAATVLIEGDGRVVFCNGAAVGLFGRDLAGQNLSTGDFDDDRPFVATLAARYRAATSRRAPLREMLSSSEEGEPRFFWAISTPSGGTARKGGRTQDEQVLLILDVTETLSASASVRKVFSQVNHDLRSPLTSIAGAAELLQSGRVGELEGMQKRLVTIVEEGARKIAEILAATKARLSDRKKAVVAGEEAR